MNNLFRNLSDFSVVYRLSLGVIVSSLLLASNQVVCLLILLPGISDSRAKKFLSMDSMDCLLVDWLIDVVGRVVTVD